MPVLFVAPTARNGPGFVWVTVTVFVMDVAVTPTPAGHKPIAAATLAARFVVLPSVAKVPLVALPHEFEPLVPAVTPLHVKMPVLFVAAAEKAETVKSPFVLLVTVTWLVLPPVPCAAVTPAPTGHIPIASTRFAAKVDVLALLAKLPLVAL